MQVDRSIQAGLGATMGHQTFSRAGRSVVGADQGMQARMGAAVGHQTFLATGRSVVGADWGMQDGGISGPPSLLWGTYISGRESLGHTGQDWRQQVHQ